MKAMYLVPLCALLTACADTPEPAAVPVVELVVPEQPPALRFCAVEPPIPDPLTNAAVAEFIARSVMAGRDCRETLADMNQWLDAARKRAAE